jgi:hypothetical protein
MNAVSDPDADAFLIDLAALADDEREGLLLLVEVERMAVMFDGETLVIGADDADKARELLAIVTDAPTATRRPERDPLMADAPVPLPPGSHAFNRGIELRPRHRSAIAAALVAAALAAAAWLATRDRRSR